MMSRLGNRRDTNQRQNGGLAGRNAHVPRNTSRAKLDEAAPANYFFLKVLKNATTLSTSAGIRPETGFIFPMPLVMIFLRSASDIF
jgi:hypothetical protein